MRGVGKYVLGGLLLFAGACSEADRLSEPDVEAQADVGSNIVSVTVTPGTLTLDPGEFTRLTATARNVNGNAVNGARATWESSNTAVVTVDTWGAVNAVAPGTAVVRATVGTVSDAATVTVRGATTPPPPTASQVQVSPATVSMAVGAMQQLSAVVTDANGNVLSGQTIRWTSSNPAVALVSEWGRVYGAANGTATITASTDVGSGTAQVTVGTATPAPTVSAVVITPTSATVQAGQTVQLLASALDANGNVLSGQTITWASSNTQVATVSASGIVTGVAAGNAVVSASSGGHTAAAAITVVAPAPTPTPVASVSVTPSSGTLLVGQTLQLTATTRDASGNVLSGRTVTWSSSNTGVATVSGSGLVTAVAAGSATITATSEGRSATAAITVSASSTPPPPSSGTRTVLFASDWSTELGTSTNARTDGGRWNIIGDPGIGLASVPCASLGFPTPNCLRVTAVETAGGFARLARTGLPIPANGQSVFYRWYFRSEIPLTGDNSTHPIESGNTGGLDWMFNVQVQSNTTWYPEFRPGGNQTDATRARWTGPLLNNGVTYRFELQIHKLSDREFQAHIRVYDASGALIASDADFNNYRGGLFPSTRMSLADNPTLNFATNGGLNLQEYRAGINSLVTSGYGSILYAYQGGFAACSGNWCGPWVSGEGR